MVFSGLVSTHKSLPDVLLLIFAELRFHRAPWLLLPKSVIRKKRGSNLEPAQNECLLWMPIHPLDTSKCHDKIINNKHYQAGIKFADLCTLFRD